MADLCGCPWSFCWESVPCRHESLLPHAGCILNSNSSCMSIVEPSSICTLAPCHRTLHPRDCQGHHGPAARLLVTERLPHDQLFAVEPYEHHGQPLMRCRDPTLEEITLAAGLTAKQVQRSLQACAMRVAFMSEPRSRGAHRKGNGASVSPAPLPHSARVHKLRA